MNLRILQQHNRLTIFNSPICDHRESIVERQFDDFNDLVLYPNLIGYLLIWVIFSRKEIDQLSHPPGDI